MKIIGKALIMTLVLVLVAGVAFAFDMVIGETLISLNGERQHVRSQETNLGNLITDMIRHYTGADIAVYNGGGIRAPADLGELTIENAMEIMAFNNEVVVLKMSGAAVLAMLEHGLAHYPEYAGRFLQVSGIRFFFDPSMPAGERIWMSFVGGDPLMPGKMYTVATNDFLAAGGDAFTMLEAAEQVAVADMTDQQMLINYIQEFSPLFPKVEGRIVVW